MTPTPFPEVAPARRARFAPSRLNIPRIGIDTAVVPVGVTADGQLGTPGDYSTVGWYEDGPAPGEAGRAIIDGHLDSRDGPAVFYRLEELAPGDEIIVRSGRAGDELRFIVREVASFPSAEAPLDQLFGPSDRPELVLITCDGPFDRAGGGYLERLIVFAEFVESPGS
jgi:sortase (surface protein transpeptidase)